MNRSYALYRMFREQQRNNPDYNTEYNKSGIGFMPNLEYRDRRYTYDGDYDRETWRGGNIYNLNDYHSSKYPSQKDVPNSHEQYIPPTSLTKQEAHNWTSRMRNADGSKGEHWSFEESTEIMKTKNIEANPYDFYAVLNMMYSDYCKVAHKFGANHQDFYVEMAKAFLEDKDAVDEKTVIYYDCIIL